MLHRLHLTANGRQIPVLARHPASWYAYVLLPNGNIARVPHISLRLAPNKVLDAHKQNPYGGELLPVTIVPQSNCNVGCDYCINNVGLTEDGKVRRIPSGFMSEPLIDATADFIGRELDRKRLRGTNLLLFGGEPLLSPERCYRILEKVPHVKVAHVITNGTHLTVEVAEQLARRGVVDVQVTFDGRKEDHDRIRHLVKGGGTYDTIVANLCSLDARPDLLPERRLRVNVSAENIAGLDELVEDLARKLNPGLYTLYFALVNDNGFGWQDGLDPQATLDRREELTVKATQLGFQPAVNIQIEGDCGFCSGEFGDGGMVVGPDGRLYSSWDTMGHEGKDVGNVRDGYANRQTHADRWLHCGDQSRNNSPAHQPPADEVVRESTWLYFEDQVRQLLSAS